MSVEESNNKHVQMTASQLAMQIHGIGVMERRDEVTEVLATLAEFRNDREDDPNTWMAGFLAAFDIIAGNFAHDLHPDILAMMQDLSNKELEMATEGEPPGQPAADADSVTQEIPAAVA